MTSAANFDASKVFASMATGGMDTVRQVGLPSDLALIHPIEEHIELRDGPTIEQIINVKSTYDCSIWKIFENAVYCTPNFVGGGKYLGDIRGSSFDTKPLIDLIDPTSWAVFDPLVLQFRQMKKERGTHDWWALPRNEMPEGIRRFRAEHGLETSESQMTQIMKWVDRELEMKNRYL